MEHYFMSRMFENKTIMNPMNPQEVFTCKDLINGISLLLKYVGVVTMFVYRLQDM